MFKYNPGWYLFLPLSSRAMAPTVSPRLLTAKFPALDLCCAQGQVSYPVLRFSPVNTVPHTSSSTCWSYQKDKPAKSWNLPQSNALSKIEDRWTDNHFHLVVLVLKTHMFYLTLEDSAVAHPFSNNATHVQMNCTVSWLSPTEAVSSFCRENVSKVSNKMYIERTEP